MSKRVLACIFLGRKERLRGGIALHLFAAENESLLDRGDTLLLLDALLNPRYLYIAIYISTSVYKAGFVRNLLVFSLVAGERCSVRGEFGNASRLAGELPCSQAQYRARSLFR